MHSPIPYRYREGHTGSDDPTVYDRLYSPWMREHLHLSRIAAELRRAAIEAPFNEPSIEIRLLLEKLEQCETVGDACDNAPIPPPVPVRGTRS